MGASGLQGWASALGPGKLTLRCRVFLRQKAFSVCLFVFLPFKRVFKNRENQTKPQGIFPLPRASPRLSVLAPFPPVWFSFFSFKHLHGLGVRLGWGFLGTWGSTMFLGWGLLLPFSPPPPHLSTRIGHSPLPPSLQGFHH